MTLNLHSHRARLAGVLVLVVLILAGLFALPWLLIAAPQTPTSDVILHTAITQDFEADAYVAQLYRTGVAKKIVCVSRASLCSIYPADFARQHLLEMGIPAEDVLTLHLPDADCVVPQFLRMQEMAQTYGWQRAIIVMRPQHSWTEGRLARAHFSRAGIHLAVTYTPNDYRQYTAWWWANHQTAQSIIDAGINGLLDPWYPECR